MKGKDKEHLPPLPTEAELRVLRVLWEQGPGTVRDVHDAMGTDGIGYTTVLKALQVMHEKGLVERQRLSRYTRAHVYSPVVSRDETEKRLVDDLANRAFNGSLPRLVLQALSSTHTDPDEIERIRSLLERHQEDQT